VIIDKEFFVQANNYFVGWIFWFGLFVFGFFLWLSFVTVIVVMQEMYKFAIDYLDKQKRS
jgi:polyferredoxin